MSSTSGDESSAHKPRRITKVSKQKTAAEPQQDGQLGLQESHLQESHIQQPHIQQPIQQSIPIAAAHESTQAAGSSSTYSPLMDSLPSDALQIRIAAVENARNFYRSLLQNVKDAKYREGFIDRIFGKYSYEQIKQENSAAGRYIDDVNKVHKIAQGKVREYAAVLEKKIQEYDEMQQKIKDKEVPYSIKDRLMAEGQRKMQEIELSVSIISRYQSLEKRLQENAS